MNSDDLVCEILSAVDFNMKDSSQVYNQKPMIKILSESSAIDSSNHYGDISIEDFNTMFGNDSLNSLTNTDFFTLLSNDDNNIDTLTNEEKINFESIDIPDFEIFLNNLTAKNTILPILPESPLVNENVSLGESDYISTDSSPDDTKMDTQEANSYTYNTPTDTPTTKVQPHPQEHVIHLDETSPIPRVPLPKFETFRQFNNITVQDFSLANLEADIEHTYEANKPGEVLTKYTPRVYRNLRKLDIEKKSRPNRIVKREGLCPYCPLDFLNSNLESYFHDMNSSQYAAHMLNFHGIFTTGGVVKEPVIHRIGIEKKPGKNLEVECIQCPYSDCHANIKISSKKFGCHKFATYFRHVKKCHRERKNHRRVISKF